MSEGLKRRLVNLERSQGRGLVARMRAFPGGPEAFLKTATLEELTLIANSGTPEENAVFDALTIEELQEVADGATPERWEAIQAAARARGIGQ